MINFTNNQKKDSHKILQHLNSYQIETQNQQAD